MRRRPLEWMLKAVALLVVGVVFAAASFVVSSLFVGHRPAFALSAGKSFTVTSAVDKTYPSCTASTTPAQLFPGRTQCLAVTVHNPLSVAIDVTALSMTVASFTPAPTDHDTPSCQTTMLTAPTTLTHAFVVTAGATHTIDEPIGLKTTTHTTEDACENGTFKVTFSGSATYTDTTTTSLSASRSGTTGVLKATVTPADPSFDPYGPGSTTAPVHHVTFYSCGTTASCATKSVVTTVTLSTTTSTTGAATATKDVTGLTTPGTYYFEVAYPANGDAAGTFAGSTSTPEKITVPAPTSSSPSGPPSGGPPATTGQSTTTGPTAPTAPAPPSGATSHTSCSVASGTCNTTNAGVTVTASGGSGALTVSAYASDPDGAPSFSSTGSYFDVEIASGSAFDSVTLKDCNLSGATALYWWDSTTSTWEPVSPVTGPAGTPPCLTATLTSTSTPSLAELTGTVFAVGTPTAPSTTRVSGETADATAAAELTRAFPYTKGSCPSSRAAVVATTKTYQDALSSQFLAESLTTGTLLTPTESLSSVTATTLRDEGIKTVYVVGGPLAITATVVKAIEALTADACGGTTRGTTTGKITVQRLYGKTQYGTAEAVATHVGAAASKAFTGAYATTNASGGTGRYNDTAAKGTAAPTGSVPTAILASGQEFQDAQAASVVSYRTKLPLLLTPAATLSTTAVTAIHKLGVKQVVLLGGPLAVSSTVEQALVEKTGVSVLRVAGTAYTDTAAELARFEAAGGTAGLGWTPGHRVLVARGDGFTDGLAGAVLDNAHNTATGPAGAARPLLLTESPTVLGTPLGAFLKTTGHTGIGKTKAKAITGLTVLGGTLAVSTAVVTQIETDLAH